MNTFAVWVDAYGLVIISLLDSASPICLPVVVSGFVIFASPFRSSFFTKFSCLEFDICLPDCLHTCLLTFASALWVGVGRAWFTSIVSPNYLPSCPLAVAWLSVGGMENLSSRILTWSIRLPSVCLFPACVLGSHPFSLQFSLHGLLSSLVFLVYFLLASSCLSYG